MNPPRAAANIYYRYEKNTAVKSLSFPILLALSELLVIEKFLNNV